MQIYIYIYTHIIIIILNERVRIKQLSSLLYQRNFILFLQNTHKYSYQHVCSCFIAMRSHKTIQMSRSAIILSQIRYLTHKIPL